MKTQLKMNEVFYPITKFFKIQSFWADDYTFPDPLDSGQIIACESIDDAIEEAKTNIKPQVKRFIETEILEEDLAVLSYYPTPSKNKSGYIETIQITEATQEDFNAQEWVKFERQFNL
jgi:hypothetical protein